MVSTSNEEEDCHHDLLEYHQLQTLQSLDPSTGSDPPVHPQLVRRHHGHRRACVGVGATAVQFAWLARDCRSAVVVHHRPVCAVQRAVCGPLGDVFPRSAEDFRALHGVDVLRHDSHGTSDDSQRPAVVWPATLGQRCDPPGASAVVAGCGHGPGLRRVDPVHDVHPPGTQHRPDDRRLAIAGGGCRSRRRQRWPARTTPGRCPFATGDAGDQLRTVGVFPAGGVQHPHYPDAAHGPA